MSNTQPSAKKKPIILVLAAHDPSAGAGIQADIETLAAHQCIAAPVITSLTAQNAHIFAHHTPQNNHDFATQIKLVMDDMPITAGKIGAIGSTPLVKTIHQIISSTTFPIVLDPVIRSTTGYHFADQATLTLMRKLLLPLTTVITPNLNEALLLTNSDKPQTAADKLLKMGCKNILITDMIPSQTQVTNCLYQHNGQQQTYTYQRLLGNYHGSGCTLSAAISARLAQKKPINIAIEQAQEYTWNSLKHGLALRITSDQAQLIPNRFFAQTLCSDTPYIHDETN